MGANAGLSLSNTITYDPNTYNTATPPATNEVCGSYTPPAEPTEFKAELDIW